MLPGASGGASAGLLRLLRTGLGVWEMALLSVLVIVVLVLLLAAWRGMAKRGPGPRAVVPPPGEGRIAARRILHRCLGRPRLFPLAAQSKSGWYRVTLWCPGRPPNRRNSRQFRRLGPQRHPR